MTYEGPYERTYDRLDRAPPHTRYDPSTRTSRPSRTWVDDSSCPPTRFDDSGEKLYSEADFKRFYDYMMSKLKRTARTTGETDENDPCDEPWRRSSIFADDDTDAEDFEFDRVMRDFCQRRKVAVRAPVASSVYVDHPSPANQRLSILESWEQADIKVFNAHARAGLPKQINHTQLSLRYDHSCQVNGIAAEVFIGSYQKRFDFGDIYGEERRFMWTLRISATVRADNDVFSSMGTLDGTLIRTVWLDGGSYRHDLPNVSTSTRVGTLDDVDGGEMAVMWSLKPKLAQQVFFGDSQEYDGRWLSNLGEVSGQLYLSCEPIRPQYLQPVRHPPL